MLNLLKKKPEAAGGAPQGPVLPPWHPDFRDFERLPDIKVVRTAFFVNTVAIALVLAALGWFGYQEYQLLDLRRQAEEWQAQIDRDQRAGGMAISLYRKFQTEEARVGEVETFVSSRPVVTQLLLNLGRTLPANIALDTLDLRENTLRLTGTIRGAPDAASGYATAYVESLRHDEFFAARYEDITMLNLTRNPQTGRLAMEVVLKLKASDKDGKKP